MVLTHKGKKSDDPDKVRAAEELSAKLHDVLSSPNHRWYDNKMDPAEAARRKKAAEDFKARYQN